MSIGFLSIGLTGIRAAALGLQTTNHNITNSSSDGYSRQSTVQAASIAIMSGSGTVGQGTEVSTIKRAYDQFLTKQYNTAQMNSSYASAYQYEISQIDNLLADETAGLTTVLQSFFSSVQDVANDPSSVSARQTLTSSAQTMVNRYQSLQGRVDELAAEVNGKITVAVSEINASIDEIAKISESIKLTESAYNQPANDLRDQRDLLVHNLSKLININTVTGSDGSFSVFTGTGQRLVSSSGEVTHLTAEVSSQIPNRVVVGLETANGGSMELPESIIDGGELGGLLKFRSESMDAATNELGRVAASMALVFNAQHAQGQDLLGNSAGDVGFVADFFDMTNMQPQTTTDPQNRGDAVVSATFTPAEFGPETTDGNYYSLLTTSDYRLTRVSDTEYELTRMSDYTSVRGDWDAVNDFAESQGFTMTQQNQATEQVNDSYYIRPTANAAANLKVTSELAADPRLLAIALPFATESGSTNTGTGVISQGVSAPGDNAGVTMPVTFEFQLAAGADPDRLTYTGITAGTVITYKNPGEDEQEVTATAGGSIPYTQGMSISVGGMTFTLSGQPNATDTFSLTENTGAISDARNGLAMGELQTQNTTGGDLGTNKATNTLQGAYAEMVGFIGVKANEMLIASEAADTVLEQATANQQSLAGVNLDEEYVNMVKYQQAYQASARIIEVAGVLFETIVNLR